MTLPLQIATVLLALFWFCACAPLRQVACPPKRPCSATVANLNDVPLIPRAFLFTTAGRYNFEISPDGRRLSFLLDEGETPTLWVQTIGREDARKLVAQKGAALVNLGWSRDNQSVLFLTDEQGKEDWQLHQVFADSGTRRHLLELGVLTRLDHGFIMGQDEKRLLVAVRRFYKPYYGSKVVVEIDLKSGANRVIEHKARAHVIQWRADKNLQVRAMVIASADCKGWPCKTALLTRSQTGSEWKRLRAWTKEENWMMFRVSDDGRFLLMADNKNSDTMRLFWLDLASGHILDVFNEPNAELDCFRSRGTLLVDKEVLAVATDDGRRKWHLVNRGIEPEFSLLRNFAGGDDFAVLSGSHDFRRWIVEINSDTASRRTCLYDRDTGKINPLSVHLPGLSDFRLAPMETVRIPNRAGLELVSYLTRPPVPRDQKVPLVVFVHGGPEARDHWGLDRFVQLLANRGYAVLQVNYSGSLGLGKRIRQAGKDARYGGKTVADLQDASTWAKEHAGIDESRVAIMGFSYGGYATLGGLAQTPELYVCGVEGFGVSDLLAQGRLHANPKKSLKAAREMLFDKRREDAQIKSPMETPERIRAPLMVVHGANDRRVKLEQSEDIVAEIRAAGGCAEFVLYPDEGHGFARESNLIDFAGRLETFLARHLCGRAEPYARPEATSAQVE